MGISASKFTWLHLPSRSSQCPVTASICYLLLTLLLKGSSLHTFLSTHSRSAHSPRSILRGRLLYKFLRDLRPMSLIRFINNLFFDSFFFHIKANLARIAQHFSRLLHHFLFHSLSLSIFQIITFSHSFFVFKIV